jgi:hypothetical protein
MLVLFFWINVCASVGCVVGSPLLCSPCIGAIVGTGFGSKMCSSSPCTNNSLILLHGSIK